jgi:hypothetical protein
VKSEFAQLKKRRNIGHNESAHGFVLRHSIARLLSDVVLEEAYQKGVSLTIVHENGDANAADMQRVFNVIKKISPEHNRRLASFGSADKESSVGLQIGDFLAVTARKYINRTDALGRYPEEPAILSILRDGIYMIDDVVIGWNEEQPA